MIAEARGRGRSHAGAFEATNYRYAFAQTSSIANRRLADPDTDSKATITEIGKIGGNEISPVPDRDGDTVYLTGESKAMRVSRLATWVMAGLFCLAGASVLWRGQAWAADAAKGARETNRQSRERNMPGLSRE